MVGISGAAPKGGRFRAADSRRAFSGNFKGDFSGNLKGNLKGNFGGKIMPMQNTSIPTRGAFP
ncbi:hypothetical protein [Paraburkholderia ferrariae]|uniref:hypothetical protein n=1 Tax=Paraburkholderia ferrariae TaxID=386056 RepID=UPI000AB80FC4|nr:hypothetical protein [Paraburkholderia ferrariae]